MLWEVRSLDRWDGGSTCAQICGVTTDVCVLGTVKDAIDRGYDALLLQDGCAAAASDLNDAVMRSVQLEGGIAGCVANVGDVIEALKNQ